MREKIARVSQSVAAWAVALIPLGMACGSAPKNVFMGVALASGSLFLWAGAGRARWRTPLTVTYLVFMGISALSLFNTVDFNDSFRGLFKLVEYLLVMTVVANTLRTEKDLRRVVYFCALGLALVGVDAVFQLVTGKDFLRGYALIENIGLYRVTASFVDSNVFGIFLSALAPLILGLARYSFRGRQRWMLAVVGLLALVASLLTYSRPTLLALFVSLAVIAFVKRDKIVIVLMATLLVASVFLAPASVRQWAKSVDYDPVRFMCNDDRIAAYRNSLQMIKDHPVIGVGINTFMKNYKKYKESPEYRGVVTSDYMYAHNNVLHMAGENGLSGLAAFIWVLVVLSSIGIRVFRSLSPGFLKDLTLCVLACLAAFLINGLTESSLYYSRVALIFWYLAGMILSLAAIRHE